jgi:hypothetical protein
MNVVFAVRSINLGALRFIGSFPVVEASAEDCTSYDDVRICCPIITFGGFLPVDCA